MRQAAAQIALVTGGGVRIGHAISLALAGSGFAVAIQYRRSRSAAEATVAAILQSGGSAASFEADLSNGAQVEAPIPAVNTLLGGVTCVVNNASHFADDRLQNVTNAGWDAHIGVNLKAPIFLAQAFATQLPHNAPGNVINIADQRVLRPNPLFFSYTLSKMALCAATKTMAQALSPRIRVNAIAPGPTLKNTYQSGGDFEHEAAAMPLGHGTTPDEIAEAVLFILRSPALTGQTIALDGGQHLLWQTPDVRVT